MKKRRAQHLEDLPDQGLSIANEVAQPLFLVCPHCRIRLLGFLCSMAIQQIVPEERDEYTMALYREIKEACAHIEPIILN